MMEDGFEIEGCRDTTKAIYEVIERVIATDQAGIGYPLVVFREKRTNTGLVYQQNRRPNHMADVYINVVVGYSYELEFDTNGIIVSIDGDAIREN